MKSDWLQEKLPDVKEIQKRIKMVFPREVDMNGYINREMGFWDRSDVASRKLLTSVAWGTFVWFASEPREIVYFREGLEGKPISVWEMQKNC